MIKLEVKDYCQHGCMNFEPRVNKFNVTGASEIVIRCESASRCEYMMRYLNNHSKENADEGVRDDG